MFRAYNLAVQNSSAFSKWHSAGKESYNKLRSSARGDLEKYLVEQALDGTRIGNDWFRTVDAQVFISHSHDDEDLAVGLAGFFRSLGVTCFVDSMVWGNAVELNRQIDDKYCMAPDKKTYDYSKRNHSTSHVHMMLASALVEMIDRAECVIFLNTPTSISSKDSNTEDRSVTASPWIYHELSTTKIVRRRRPERASMESQRLTEVVAKRDLRITYDAPLAHLQSISLSEIMSLSSLGAGGAEALDKLYRLT